ncbi:MAG: LysR family transcriptional regulator [Polyangiaceae bacterium]|nr:LysR family transcriptional regulator [Polyangiaceae bacterium]
MNHAHDGHPAAALAKFDLNLLVTLAVLLEESSVTQAAARLGRTQSAISHALVRLRSALGDPLFVRSGQTLVPTPKAESLRAPVRNLTNSFYDLWLGTTPFNPATATQHISIMASDYLQWVLIPPLIRRLRAVAPGITLEVRSPSPRALEKLSRGEVDFSLAVKLDPSPSLFSQKLFEDHFVCLVGSDHPTIKRQKDLDRAAFLTLPHALVTPLGGNAGHVDTELARTGESRQIKVLLPHFMMAPRLLQGTDLILTLPERVARLFANDEVRILNPPIPLPKLTGHLVWHERLSRDPAAVWFRNLAAQAVKDLKAS